MLLAPGVTVERLSLDEFTRIDTRPDAVISGCSNEAELRALVLGPGGYLHGERRGLVFIDTSHIGEELSREISEAAQQAGVGYLRAPLTQAPFSEGDTTVAYTAMVSGPSETFAVARGLLEILANKVFYLGAAEEARAMTRVLDVMSGISIAMWAEALVFGEAVGLDWQEMLQVMETSAIGSPLLKEHTPLVAQRDFSSTLECEEMVARLATVLAQGKSLGVTLTLTGLAQQMYLGALRHADANQGVTGIIPWLEVAASIS
jgi:3-hydroxyisobutyrate dehydrogenase-like beta-hydroxyacid dehydrogenase